jgi:serine/threonine protein kinase
VEPEGDSSATEVGGGVPAAPGQLPAGTMVNRFLITGVVGQGAMGVVYEAYDPRLDRRIALKLLRHGGRGEADGRFLREAQALARLSHPNVVQVHDVGEWDDKAYIALELIKGRSLDAWLREKQRSTSDVLEVLVAAGRGLSAAHQAGIVHRDFKPANVMVGEDGRTRVLDFGVARGTARALTDEATQATDHEPHELATANYDATQPDTVRLGTSSSEGEPAQRTHDSQDSGASRTRDTILDTPLTLAGSIVGTPAFMAPEQLQGEAVDARCDQFAFATTSYGALYGERPFRGKTGAQLLEAMRQPPLPTKASTRRVPRHVQRALLRGLSFDPGARFKDMDALLAELSRDPFEAVRRLALAALVLVAAAMVVLGLRARQAPVKDPCATAARALDQVWNPQVRSALSEAFTAGGRVNAEDTFAHTVAALDDYARGWRSMRVEACEATEVEHTQSPALLDKRMSCLDQRLAALRALLAFYERDGRDAESLDSSVGAVLRLPELAPCADAAALTALSPLPEDAHTRRAIARAREELARGHALWLAGRFADAQQVVDGLLPLAKKLGFPPLLADVLERLAGIEDDLGNFERAEALHYEALEAAARAGNLKLVAELWGGLIWVAGYHRERYADVVLLDKAARVALAAAGDPPGARAAILGAEGVVHLYAEPHSDRAVNELREALALRKKALGADSIAVAHLLDALGVALEARGHVQEALACAQESLRIRERKLGSQHVDVAFALLNLAEGYLELGEPDAAEPYAVRAAALREQVLGSQHVDTGWAVLTLGEVRRAQRRYDEAELAVARAEPMLGSSIAEGTLGGAMYRAIRAQLSLDRGRAQEAAGLARSAMEEAQKATGDPEHPTAGSALFVLGQAQARLGDLRGAARTLEQALAQATKREDAPYSLAAHEFRLAETLWSTPAARKRAVALASAARQRLDEEQPSTLSRRLRDEIGAWASAYSAR